MEDSRRLRGELCPTCRISHQPFCPPPRPFYGNGFPPDDPFRFPVQPPPFHRPFPVPQPFTERSRMSPPPLPHHPYPMVPRSAEYWGGYPLPERVPFRQSFHPPERLLSEESLEREWFHKRMKVEEREERPLGYSASPQLPDRFGAFPTMVSLEDERRLNLIRHHGRAQGNSPFDGEQRPNGGFPVDRHPHVDSRYAWSGSDRDLYGPSVALTGSYDPVAHIPPFFNPKNHALREGSYGDYRDPAGAQDSQDPGRFVHFEAKELERKEWDAGNNLRSNSSLAGIRQEQYGHRDASSHPSRSYGNGDVAPESLKHCTVHHNPEVNSKYKQYFSEEHVNNLQKQLPHSSSYTVSQESREMLGHREHLQQTGVFEPGYPRADSYQSPFVTNVGHHGHLDRLVHEYAENKHEAPAQKSEVLPSFEPKAPLLEDSFRPLVPQNYHMLGRSDVQINQRNHMPMQSGSGMPASMGGQLQAPQTSRPPPPQLLPTLPSEPSLFHITSSLPMALPSVSSVPIVLTGDVSHAVQGFSESPATSGVVFSKEQAGNTSTGILTERRSLIPQILSNQHAEKGQKFALKRALTDKRTTIDASHVFLQPHRATRPDHIVVILRGLPGSGKSYLAKALRDLEVDNGGNAPRIHCMDDYFMTEVEKVEESDGSKGKKQITRKVMEFCYEPEMEERSGYEVYLLEATYKDPTGCAARNVHGFTLEDIKGMAEKWEESPAFYLQLDTQSLFSGDNLNESNIQE
ncbi:hypothetical protein Taro_002941, partial [Colocasia esculenta]|nr:hypothetical protein [Colocasia esculenta]